MANQSDAALKILKLNGSIKLDGRVDEPAWLEIPPLPLTTHWPEFGNKPSAHTEIRITYDDDYIYCSGICTAPPDQILAASFKRDLFTLGTDYLSLILDTFDDNESALVFSTTPTGNRSDQAVSEDGNKLSTSWNTFWDAEANISETGWSAEMRIPFSSLGFQVVNDEVRMGVIAWRYFAQKNEMDIFPAVKPDWGFWSFVKPSQMHKVVFKGIKSSNPVYITPYLLAGAGQEAILNADETAYKKQNDLTKNLGLDAKYNITDNLTLDFSLNTDFAQVEADNQQVNLTRFSLFFPEKRQFFLERASTFDFGFSGSDRLFYTRRIGLQDGEPVTIFGGSRLSGRIGTWDVGALDVQTSSGNGLIAENFAVLRLRKQVFNPYSYLGMISTSRAGEDGNLNLGFGLDGIFRLFDNDYLSFKYAQTYDKRVDYSYDFLNASRGYLLWERRSYNNFAYLFSVGRSGKDYNPAMGYQRRENFTRYNSVLSYGWNLNGHPLLQRHQVLVSAEAFSRNEDGALETAEISPKWEGAFAGGGFFGIGVTAISENLNEAFELWDGVEIEAGKHQYAKIVGNFSTPGGKELSADLDMSYGSFFDGSRLSASVSPKWITSKYLELSGTYQFDLLDFPKRHKSLESHVLRLRGLLALNTKLSLAAFIQYNSSADISLVNMRFRYNPAEGNDLYIVYNEQFNQDRKRELPTLPFTRNRAVLAKYTYTFSF